MNTLQTIPVDLIDVGDDFNPRRETAVDDGFLASVKAHGILTPILVHPQGSGKKTRYFLVAGERRYRAAIAEGHAEIPAVIRAEFAAGGALPAALVENMQRKQLSPIEEARAFERAIHEGLTPSELADATGVSADTIKGRLALLQLPASAQELVDDGSLTLAAAAALKTLAAAGEKVVEKTAELIVNDTAEPWDDPIGAHELETDPAWVLEQTLNELDPADRPFLVKVGRHYVVDPARIEWPAGIGEGLAEKANRLPEYDRDTHKSVRRDATACTDADIDAARAFGCLLELGAGKGRSGLWVTDAVWLADRLGEQLDKATAAWERKRKKAAKSAGTAVGDETERKRGEREQAKAEQLSARERNVSLRNALLQLRTVEPTLDAIKAVGGLLLEYAGTDLGHAYRFVDERCETVKTKKTGEISSLTYSRDADHHLLAALEEADTPERALGVLVGALAAGVFVDVKAARQSDRYCHLRGLHGYSPNKELVDTVTRLAEPILPADIKLEIKERQELEAVERANEKAEFRAEYASSDLPSRVRSGAEVCPSCGNSAAGLQPDEFVACACTGEQIVDAAVACPRCGELECFASCSAFLVDAAVEEPAAA